MDVSGRLVYSNMPEANGNRITIPTGLLETGLYFLVTETDQGQLTKSFLKL